MDGGAGSGEGCPVIGQTEAALHFWDNITSPETELTSRWCSNSRTLEELTNEAKQMTTAQEPLVQLHTLRGTSPSQCESAASQYRVGLIRFSNKAASSFFKGALWSARAG
jgi:hypothetical protein